MFDDRRHAPAYVVAHRFVGRFGIVAGENVSQRAMENGRYGGAPLGGRIVEPVENQNLVLFDRIAQCFAARVLRDARVKLHMHGVQLKQEVRVGVCFALAEAFVQPFGHPL